MLVRVYSTLCIQAGSPYFWMYGRTNLRRVIFGSIHDGIDTIFRLVSYDVDKTVDIYNVTRSFVSNYA
jgi:hypothetical protein